MEAGLSLSLKQQLRISTQLVQTMEFLALSTEELAEKIHKEAETNPAMIVKEPSVSFDTFSANYRGKTEKRESFSDSASYGSDIGEDKEETNWVEGMIGEKESLQEHLLKGLGCLDIDEDVENAAITIITALDKNGFTGPEPENLLPESSRHLASQALKAIQSLDPTGVGAIDWKHSLMLQIQESGAQKDEQELFEKLIYNELENLKAGKTALVAKNLDTEEEDVKALYAFLKTLTPYPGLKYNSDYETYILPEISIKKEDGVLRMKVNKDALPIVEVEPAYLEMESSLKNSKSSKDKEAMKFLKEKISSVNSLRSLIEARTSTLEKTGLSLLKHQMAFFNDGPLYLKGLTMKQVAEDVGVHEATISRIAASKYIDTDFGIYPIRQLFSAQTVSDSGEEHSRHAIKEMIKKIIQENDTGKALSDQKISEALEKAGFKAARRTVSKYRKELDIDSSFSRSK